MYILIQAVESVDISALSLKITDNLTIFLLFQILPCFPAQNISKDDISMSKTNKVK